MSDAETIDVYNQSAQTYADLLKTGKPEIGMINFSHRLKPGGLVLDLGCGPGKAAAEFRDAGFEVDAIGASPGMVDLANETYQIGARVADFDYVQQTHHFDGIWANFSLLHTKRDAFSGYLTALVTALKPGGLLHIGMKLGDGEERDSIGRFYTYYTEKDLRERIAGEGLTLVSLEFGNSPGLSGQIAPWVILITQKPDS